MIWGPRRSTSTFTVDARGNNFHSPPSPGRPGSAFKGFANDELNNLIAARIPASAKSSATMWKATPNLLSTSDRPKVFRERLCLKTEPVL